MRLKYEIYENYCKYTFFLVSFIHLKALFDAVVQSEDEDSFQTLQLAGKSEEKVCNQSQSFGETASLMAATSLHPDTPASTMTACAVLC